MTCRLIPYEDGVTKCCRQDSDGRPDRSSTSQQAQKSLKRKRRRISSESNGHYTESCQSDHGVDDEQSDNRSDELLEEDETLEMNGSPALDGLPELDGSPEAVQSLLLRWTYLPEDNVTKYTGSVFFDQMQETIAAGVLTSLRRRSQA